MYKAIRFYLFLGKVYECAVAFTDSLLCVW